MYTLCSVSLSVIQIIIHMEVQLSTPFSHGTTHYKHFYKRTVIDANRTKLTDTDDITDTFLSIKLNIHFN